MSTATKTRGSRRSPSKSASQTTPSQQHQDRTPSASIRSQSPISPSRVTRLKEKEELQGLNDRLVVYIDTVRRLESDNSQLKSEIRSYSDCSIRDVNEIKALYERELEDAKTLVDDLAKGKAKIEIEMSKYKGEYEDVSSKLVKREREFKIVEQRLKALEIENQELKSKNDYLTNDNNRKGDDLSSTRSSLNDLEKQFARLKKQLEEETLLRVDLENKNQTLKEDLQFKSTLYDKEVDQLRSAKRAEIEQVDNRLRDEYDSRLISELQRIRDETDSKINDMKDDVERKYQNKLADVESAKNKLALVNGNLKDQAENAKGKIDDLSQDLLNANQKVASLEHRVRDADDKLKKANNRYDLDIGAREQELAAARKEVQDLLNEYQELYDVKIALDMEICAYRKMLEAEELRLNISSSVNAAASMSGSFLSGEDVNCHRSGKKRRIVDEDARATHLQSDETACDIKILEHDFDGKFVKLQNLSDKDIPIGGWQLKRVADENVVEFKFHKSTVVKAGQVITVWSSNANALHSPPEDIVMKQALVVADQMMTILSDKELNEQARRESKLDVEVDKRLRGTPVNNNAQPAEKTSSAKKLFSFWGK